jgi:hypothetical protein
MSEDATVIVDEWIATESRDEIRGQIETSGLIVVCNTCKGEIDGN